MLINICLAQRHMSQNDCKNMFDIQSLACTPLERYKSYPTNVSISKYWHIKERLIISVCMFLENNLLKYCSHYKPNKAKIWNTYINLHYNHVLTRKFINPCKIKCKA